MDDEKVLEESKDDETDDEIDDGYQKVQDKNKSKLSANSHKGSKQIDYGVQREIEKLLFIIQRDKEIDNLQKCIGQIGTCFGIKNKDGSDLYGYGTGTIYKQILKKYYLVITCAHNLVRFNETTNKPEEAHKLFFFPNGIKDQDTRLICVYSRFHPEYKADSTHSPNDIGLILCYDGTKHYEKKKINPNEIVEIKTCNKDALYRCDLYGYPAKCEGQLMGKMGTAIKDKQYNEWKYSNIETFGGHSGAPLYKVKELDDGKHICYIYGIHTFGVAVQQVSRGVFLNENRIKWICSTETIMEEQMIMHFEQMKIQKKIKKREKEKALTYQKIKQDYNNDIVNELTNFNIGTLQECIAASFLVTNPNDINEVQEKVIALQVGRNLRKKEINEIQQTLITVTKGEEKHQIQKFIGAIAIDYNGKENGKRTEYRYGTGTIYKHLFGKYYLCITAAHNLVYFNDKTGKQERVNEVFYLPYGREEAQRNNRLKCVDWIAHESYNARIDHDENDLGIILCYDATKHYKKQNLNVNDCVQIDASCEDQLTDCNIYEYPVKCGGQLMGNVGTATKYKNEWQHDIYTRPGASGAALYTNGGNNVFTIWGIHIFGNVEAAVGWAVYLDNERIQWIKKAETKMKEKMLQHDELRKKKK
eukprot:327266_1